MNPKPWTCFECGDTGHLASNCPNTALMQSISFMRRQPDPPTPEYLQARADMDMPSSGPRILSVPCPWCKAGQWSRCVNPGTGRETDPHTARQDAAGIGQPRPSRRLLDLALRQAAESRASRLIT